MKKIVKKNKYTVIVLIALLPFIFSGCFSASITGKINSEYLAIYRGDIELDLSKYEYSQQALAQESILKLSKYWQDIGYESQVSVDDYSCHVYFLKQKQCENYENAFKELFSMMTDDYSPFKSLSYLYTTYENYDEYSITGEIDIRNIIDQDVLAQLQADIQTIINEEISEMDAYVIFDLPDHEKSPPTSIIDAKFKILHNDTTDFSYIGKISNTYKDSQSNMMSGEYHYYNKLTYVLIGILFVLLSFVILLGMQYKKRN